MEVSSSTKLRYIKLQNITKLKIDSMNDLIDKITITIYNLTKSLKTNKTKPVEFRLIYAYTHEIGNDSHIRTYSFMKFAPVK